MKIAVCGCSFSAAVEGEYAGTHWSEVLAKKLNAELINLARQGISNSVIRLQISEAIKHNPDFVFINATTPERIEFATNKNNIFDHTLGYSFDLGLKNFNYHPDEQSRMISETVFSIIDWDKHRYRGKKVDDNVREAVKGYAAFIYDLNWRIQVDNWIIASGLWDLHDRNIKFIYNQTIINEFINSHMLPQWFQDKYLVPKDLDLLALMRANEGNVDPGYHTSPEVQIHIANRYLELIQQRFQGK